MYFTQKKTQIWECAHYRDIDCIVYASDCTLAGYQILRTGGIILHTFFMYQISSLNNESYCCGIEWSESLYCCGFRMLSIVLLVEKFQWIFWLLPWISISPPIAQLISASHIKSAPSCIRELVNEWCNGNWLWRLNWVTLLRHHHNKHWITERKQNTRQSKTSYVSVINVCTKVMSCDIEKCDTCVTWS